MTEEEGYLLERSAGEGGGGKFTRRDAACAVYIAPELLRLMMIY